MSTCSRRSSRRPRARSTNSRPRWPRPSAICPSPSIRAPFDGVIGNRAVQIGDYVQTGQRLASLVPLDDVYVDANFKETQLAAPAARPAGVASRSTRCRTATSRARSTSVSPASGSVFSLLPPDNATGNFTKIVQRVPVRIRVPAAVADARPAAARHVGRGRRRHQAAAALAEQPR